MIGVCLILSHWTSEHPAPFFFDPLAAFQREPLASGAAARAILGCSVRIDFDGHDTLRVIFLFGVLIDLSAQLIRLATIHAPGCAPPTVLDLAQPLKEQETAGVCGARLSNDARYLVGAIFVHPPDMAPELLIAVLSCDGFAG